MNRRARRFLKIAARLSQTEQDLHGSRRSSSHWNDPNRTRRAVSASLAALLLGVASFPAAAIQSTSPISSPGKEAPEIGPTLPVLFVVQAMGGCQGSGCLSEVATALLSSTYSDHYTGFFYYGYRYYNPSTGRWLNRDPIGEYGEVSLYNQSGNDVVTQYDFLGLYTCNDFCGVQCKSFGPIGAGQCMIGCLEYQEKNCGDYDLHSKLECGNVVRRATYPSDKWYRCVDNILTRVCTPHIFIKAEDGNSYDLGGDGTGEDHYTATTTRIIITKRNRSCEEFSECIKTYYEELKPYDTFENNCQHAVFGALAACGGREK